MPPKHDRTLVEALARYWHPDLYAGDEPDKSVTELLKRWSVTDKLRGIAEFIENNPDIPVPSEYHMELLTMENMQW